MANTGEETALLVHNVPNGYGLIDLGGDIENELGKRNIISCIKWASPNSKLNSDPRRKAEVYLEPGERKKIKLNDITSVYNVFMFHLWAE